MFTQRKILSGGNVVYSCEATDPNGDARSVSGEYNRRSPRKWVSCVVDGYSTREDWALDALEDTRIGYERLELREGAY